MNANLALAAQRLQRASYARSAFIGQRDLVDATTVAAIDHQLVQRVNDLRAAFIADGGTDAHADAAIARGDRQADATLDR
jgi:hypothetical protein